MNTSLFLGAGSSVPYGFPTTVQFKEKLKQIPNKSEFKALDALLENPDYLDVEHILKAIEEMMIFSKQLGAHFFSNSIVFSYRNQEGKYTFQNIMAHLNENYLKIKEYVYKFYSWNDLDVKILERNLSHVLNILSKSQDGIHIFTTNYDQSIETYVDGHSDLTCNDGFVHNFKIRRNIFDPNSFSNDKNQVNLYKLHGSLNWKMTKFGVTRLDSETQNKNDPDNLVVYPTLSPKDGMLREPFKTIRDIFEKHIYQTDIVIVIGYSFRDHHINEIFKNFLRNPNKKLFIVSPSVKVDWHQNFLKNEQYGTMELIFSKTNIPTDPAIQSFPTYYDQYLKIKFKQKEGYAGKELDDAKKQLNDILKPILPNHDTQVILVNTNIETANSLSLFGIIPIISDYC